MTRKLINFEELDAAVEASYQLGLLEGRDRCQAEMNQLRISTNQMLTVNKELFKWQKKVDSSVLISFVLAKRIKQALTTAKCFNIRTELYKAIREANAKPKPSERRNDIKEETNG